MAGRGAGHVLARQKPGRDSGSLSRLSPLPTCRPPGAAMGGSAGGDPTGPPGPAQPPDSPGGQERVQPRLLPPDSTCPATNPERKSEPWGKWLPERGSSSTGLPWSCHVTSHPQSDPRGVGTSLKPLLCKPIPGCLRGLGSTEEVPAVGVGRRGLLSWVPFSSLKWGPLGQDWTGPIRGSSQGGPVV